MNFPAARHGVSIPTDFVISTSHSLDPLCNLRNLWIEIAVIILLLGAPVISVFEHCKIEIPQADQTGFDI